MVQYSYKIRSLVPLYNNGDRRKAMKSCIREGTRYGRSPAKVGPHRLDIEKHLLPPYALAEDPEGLDSFGGSRDRDTGGSGEGTVETGNGKRPALLTSSSESGCDCTGGERYGATFSAKPVLSELSSRRGR